MRERQRIFIAINLPRDIKKILHGFQEKYPELPAKWTILDNLHITLVFLGDLTYEELGEVCVSVKEIVEKHKSFDVNLNKISYGPENKIPPKMVWATGKKVKELSTLKNNLENYLLDKINFKQELKAFTPHVTLARIREWQWKMVEPEERQEINDDIDLTFTVESIEVMLSSAGFWLEEESGLKKRGPKYTIIESHNLQ